MARIETYEARQSLQPGNTPAANLSSAVSQEVEGLGREVQDISAQLVARQRQKEEFAAEAGYRRFRLGEAEDIRARQETMAPDGTGFHEGYIAEGFRPRRDSFLQTVPERLRSKFSTLLADDGPDAYEWSTAAAGVERDRNYDWQRTEITATQQQLATAISLDPEGYDTLLADGQALIEASSLPTPERDKLLTDWEHVAQTAILNRLLETDPQGVLRELGVDARQLSPTTQFSIISRAVQWQESRDNPNAVSGKGAVGLMQVMPATAGDIARDLGDSAFPHGAPENVIRAYLSNPYVNKRYGEAYLQQQLKAFANTRNPIETALVAYNAGPAVAKRWVESGYDDSMLSKETRDYKAEILASISAPGAKGDPSSVKFEWANAAGYEAFTQPKGRIEPGNINLNTRPRVENADGSISTVRSMSFEENGVEILVPTVSDDGRLLSDKEAIAEYHRTGRHLGKFSSPEAATAFADLLHNQQDAQFSVNPDLTARVADAFSAIGLDRVRVNSGKRDSVTNALAHGAKQSEHLDGNAMDIDVSGMKIAERLELIKALSAAGITGIGVYANTIHADLGGRRAWGPDHGHQSVPKWAQPVIAEHLAGTTPPVRRVAGRYGSLPYDTRQAFTSKADQIITQQQAQLAKASAVDQVQIKQQRDNHLAMIRATGQGDPNFDETAIATILGEDDYLKFARDRDIAQRSYTATTGINELTTAEMEQRYNSYNPRVGESFEADQRVQAAVRDEIDRVTRLRTRSPDRAVLELPEVKGVAQSVADDLDAGTLEPAKMQDFITTMLNSQADLDIPPDARAPLPREWAMQIGRTLAELPRPTALSPSQRANMSPQELDDYRREDRDKVAAAVFTLYTSLEGVYGQYTDEVVAYALAEYKGVDKDRAEALNAYARAVQQGTGQIFGANRELERQTDINQSENAFPAIGFGGTLFGDPFGFNTPPSEVVDPEALLRQVEEGAAE